MLFPQMWALHQSVVGSPRAPLINTDASNMQQPQSAPSAPPATLYASATGKRSPYERDASSDDDSSDDASGDELAVALWLRNAKHAISKWPLAEPPPSHSLAIDLAGPWGAAACGVAIVPCTDNPLKGLGAFAMRPLAEGCLVGLYAGELLTQREYALRHSDHADHAAEDERAALVERAARLASLTAGAPTGGAVNGGSYVFSLIPAVLGRRAAANGARPPPTVRSVSRSDGAARRAAAQVEHAAVARAIDGANDLDDESPKPEPRTVPPPIAVPSVMASGAHCTAAIAAHRVRRVRGAGTCRASTPRTPRAPPGAATSTTRSAAPSPTRRHTHAQCTAPSPSSAQCTTHTAACYRSNLVPRIDSTRALVWFEAGRDIEAGEELAFDYGPQFGWE